jgi:hypothetical protein
MEGGFMASKQRVAKTATEGVKILWESKFFRTWQKMGAVVEALAKRENNFPNGILGKAFQRAEYLMRKGKKGTYEYIQRYPYVPEDEIKNPKKGGKK